MQTSSEALTLVMRAFDTAHSALDTDAFLIHKLRLGGQSLGIVTPFTAQWAALKKHSSPKSRAVVYRHFLNVKDNTIHTRYACLAIT